MARARGGSPDSADRLRFLQDELAFLRDRATTRAARLTEVESRLAASEDEVRRLERELRDVRESTSWRLTAPLRSLSRGIGGRRRGPVPAAEERGHAAGFAAPARTGLETSTLRQAEAELSVERYRHIIAARLANIDAYKGEIAAYQDARARSRDASAARVAVVTAIVGGYDALTVPSPLNPAYAYVLFADGPVPDPGVYDIRPIPYRHADPTRVARWVKTHAHELLADYDIVVWVDANIAIVDDLGPMLQGFLDSGAPAAAVPHPYRTNVYEEFDACIELLRDDVAVMEAQRRFYEDSGFDGAAIFETGLLMMNVRDEALKRFLDAWWSQIERFSRRDQLSVGWALRESGATMHLLMQSLANVRYHSCFCYVPHSSIDEASLALLAALEAPMLDPRGA